MHDCLELTHWIRCGRKRRYSNQRARRVAARATDLTEKLIVPYKCIDCGYWHIGHAPEYEQEVYRKLLAQRKLRQADKDSLMKIAEERNFEIPCRRCGNFIDKQRIVSNIAGNSKLPAFCSKLCRDAKDNYVNHV